MKKFLLVLTFLPSVFWGQVSPNASVTIDTSAPICNIGDCVSLNANYTNSNATDSYTVSSIPYSSFAYSGGTILSSTNSSGTNNDDFWSSTITIPFQFSFFGNCYNSLIIGTNGVLSFSQSEISQTPDGFCQWSITQNLPSTSNPVNSIFGVFQDIHYASRPPEANINYYSFGTSPNRVMVVNYYHIPQYPAQGTNLQTYQIVLHETTNIIDVNIERRVPNLAWNNGNEL